MLNKKHAHKQYISALQAENKELWRCQNENIATIQDLTAQRDILAKENGELRYMATIFKEFHEIVMSTDNALIAQFINIYHQNHLERQDELK